MAKKRCPSCDSGRIGEKTNEANNPIWYCKSCGTSSGRLKAFINYP